MIKKILWGTLFAAVIGALVVGGVIRTIDRTEKVAEASGLDNGLGGRGQQQENQSLGGGRQSSAYQATPAEWVELEGTVVEVPDEDAELVIATDDGQVSIGTGPGYMKEQGFVLQAGDQIQVQGYWEDGELKAAQITRMADGATIVLRDQSGRPAWSGASQNSQGQGGAGQSNSGGQGIQGQGSAEQSNSGRQGAQGQGGAEQDNSGRQGTQGQGGAEHGDSESECEGTPDEQLGTGQAEVKEWTELQGTVIDVTVDAMVVELESGEQIMVEGRAWSFVQEKGFTAQAGDQVTLAGFYEGEDLEVGQIDNLSNGEIVLIREESGRPLWAGGGRRGN